MLSRLELRGVRFAWAPIALAIACALFAPESVLARRDVKELREIADFEDRRSPGSGRLVELLGSENAETRAAAARALGRIGTEEFVPPLLRTLQDSDASVRLEAIFALGQIGSADARDELRVLAGSKAALEERDEAVLALGKLGGDGAAEALLPFLADPEALIRADAAIALARTADSVAALDLKPLLSDESARVRANAAWAAGRLKAKGLAAEVRALLTDGDPAVKLAATKACAQIEDVEAMKALFQLVRDPDWRVRVNVASALGATKEIEALAGLAILGKDENVNVRTAVASGLVGIPYHYKKDDILFPLRRSVEPQIRAATMEALAVGLEDQASMIDEHWLAAGDSSKAVVVAAYESFAEASRRVPEGSGMNRWRTASTFYMKGRLRNPEATLPEKIAAAYNLGAFDTAMPRPDLVSVLSREHWTVTAAAIHGLGEMTPSDTASARQHLELTPQTIADVLRDDPKANEEVDIRYLAAEALGNFDSAVARETLHRLATDDDHRVREKAAESLEKLGEARPDIAPRGELPGAADPLDETYLRTKQGRYEATLVTSRGQIKIELFNHDAPRTVQSFVDLANEGFYDGLEFHRVVPNFVIQGGCSIGNGWGHPGYTLRCEYNRHRYDGPGVVGMAHAGKDTGGSQFFITHSAQPHLDGRYTVFGRVAEGMEIVDAIQVEDVIRSIEIKKKMW